MNDKKELYKKLNRAVIIGDFVESITSTNDNPELNRIIPKYYINDDSCYPDFILKERYKKR